MSIQPLSQAQPAFSPLSYTLFTGACALALGIIGANLLTRSTPTPTPPLQQITPTPLQDRISSVVQSALDNHRF